MTTEPTDDEPSGRFVRDFKEKFRLRAEREHLYALDIITIDSDTVSALERAGQTLRAAGYTVEIEVPGVWRAALPEEAE